MADPREAARAWLAERIGWYFASDAGGNTAAAIAFSAISSEGVEVGNQLLIVNDLWRQDTDDPAYATHTQVVIRLPAQPIGETP